MFELHDTVYLENNFATRIENVNPFAVVNWIGQVELNPAQTHGLRLEELLQHMILKVVSILQWESLVQIVTLVFHLLIGVHGKQLGQDQVHLGTLQLFSETRTKLTGRSSRRGGFRRGEVFLSLQQLTS